MYSVDIYARVRRACHVDGTSKREAGRRFGIDRKTVSKILEHRLPPGYRRDGPPVRPKLDAFTQNCPNKWDHFSGFRFIKIPISPIHLLTAA
jgi:hypothetical protein